MSKKSPQLRFEGFTDDWEERKLGDVFSERSERSSEGELISVTINSGVVKASELDRKDNSSNDKSNYKKVEVGDIAYNSMRMWQGASGCSSYDGILSPAYTVIIPKEGTDSKFFAYDFKRHDMIQTFKRNSQGLTSDTWNLKFPTLKSVKVMVPCMEEQTKISNFFERLDTTITIHQRKLDLLKEQKKGFLQKMFPKNGAKVPELRFAGFADDWEERKLKDVLDISKTKNKAQQYGKVDVLSVSREVGTVNQIKYQGRSLAGSDLSNYKVVQGGELIYTKSPLKGAPYGIFQVATIKGILSPLYAVYTSTDKAYTPFVAMALKNDNIATHYLTPLVTKGAKNTINVTDEGALEGKIQFPSILEQKQIFIFFKQLDDTIALHQRKLDLLKEQKKGFLQKMFV